MDNYDFVPMSMITEFEDELVALTNRHMAEGLPPIIVAAVLIATQQEVSSAIQNIDPEQIN